MDEKTIPDLNILTKAELSGSDLLLITDLSAKETKNIETSEFREYVVSKLDSLKTGSFTGSFFGYLFGNADTSSFSNNSDLSFTSSFLTFNGDVNGTASYSITSSNSLFSISSSNSISSSFAISSSYADVTMLAFQSSSNRALRSQLSLNSDQSDLCLTSSFLNYYGQDNGTSYSSSFSEIANIVDITDDVIDGKSCIVQSSKQSDFSFFTEKSNSAITASFSNNSITADSALGRLFSSVEFRISVNGDKLDVTPISWKNIKNIAAGSIGKLFTDFYVTYKTSPPIPYGSKTDFSKLATVTLGSFQFGADNLIRNIRPRSDQAVPIFSSYIFPCGLDGFVIRLVNYTLYGRQEKGVGGILGSFERSVTGMNVGNIALTNDRGAAYWKKQLDGVVVSAQTFCNTVNFLEMGPPNNLEQFDSKGFLNTNAIIKTLTRNYTLTAFPAASNTLNALLKWNKNGITVPDTLIFNSVKSIANVSGSDYNLILLENKNYPNVFTGSQIALVQGKSFYGNSLHYPKTGSSVSASVPNVNYLYYNTSSNEYLCVANSKILYTGSNYINSYVGNSKIGTFLYSTELNNSMPIWKEYITNLQNHRICNISNNRYLLLETKVCQLKDLNQSVSNLPIYIIPNITNQSTPLIQCQDRYNKIPKTKDLIVGNNGTVIGVKAIEINETNKFKGNFRNVTIENTTFRSICVLDSKRAVVGGDNGIIFYSNNIDTASPTWMRIDALSPDQSPDSILQRNTTEYLIEINDISLLIENLEEILVVSGKDISNRSSMIYCSVPKNPNDDYTNQWQWNPVPGLFTPISQLRDNNGNIIPSQIGSSSFNTLFKDNSSIIVAGYSNIPTSSYYRFGTSDTVYPYFNGDINSSSYITSIGKCGNDNYLFGGDGILDLYTVSI